MEAYTEAVHALRRELEQLLEPLAPRERLEVIRRVVSGAEHVERKAVADARRSMSWGQIAEAYGVSRQAVQQRFGRMDPLVGAGGLAAFCERNGIRSLALFGSAARDELTDRSDIDLLVEFLPGQKPGLMAFARLEAELEEIFGGRRVDLRTPEDLSPRFRERVKDEARELYAAV